MTNEQALRYNEGKLRYDLFHPVAAEGLAKVLTFGCNKYGDRNWEKGLSWTSTIASMKRHIAAIEKGEDFDQESGFKHVDHVQCNAHFLSAYYKIAPEKDDRPHGYLTNKRIGLDIDDVLADWVGTFCRLSNTPIPTSWYFGFPEILAKLQNEGHDYDEIMNNLSVKTSPNDIPFEPTCYITSRNHTGVEVAEQWIAKNGYPQVKVIQTNDKITAAKAMNLDIFVDDKFETFQAMNNAGICTYLFDTPWNQRYDVGFKRIKSLKELI